MIPYPDPIVVRLLADLPSAAPVSGRVSTTLGTTLPALRIAKIGDAEAPSEWEATPLYQIEVWATDEIEAGQLAWDIRNGWPTSKRQVVGDGVVHARWVEINPRSFPDVDNDTITDTGTDYARYILTVGVRISGVSA